MTSPLTSLLSPHWLIAPGGVDCKFALKKKYVEYCTGLANAGAWKGKEGTTRRQRLNVLKPRDRKE
jgi:hypothetical protein